MPNAVKKKFAVVLYVVLLWFRYILTFLAGIQQAYTYNSSKSFGLEWKLDASVFILCLFLLISPLKYEIKICYKNTN